MDQKIFISESIKKIQDTGLKRFPEEFLNSFETESISVPPKSLFIGGELFGIFEVTTIEGDVIHTTDSYEKAKYIVYASRWKPAIIKIPKSEVEILAVLREYNNYLDSIMKGIATDFKYYFDDPKSLNETINQIFKILNLTRF